MKDDELNGPNPPGWHDRDGEMILELSQCHRCARYAGHDVCEAYPDGIPSNVIYNLYDHRLPHEGDHGLQFVPKSPEDEASMNEDLGEEPGIKAENYRKLLDELWPEAES
jgi:hypothetical protein